MSCQQFAKALLFDDYTIRGVYGRFELTGREGLTRIEMSGGAGKVNFGQTTALRAWGNAILPRSTQQVGAGVEKEFGIVYETSPSLLALLRCLGLEFRKPDVEITHPLLLGLEL